MFLLVAAPLLAYAALRDVMTRLIPDGVSLAIAAAGFSLRLFEGWAAAATSVGLAAVVFCSLLLLAMRGLLGGGDVKLIAATTMGLPPPDVWTFIVATVLAGGILGVAYLIGRRVVSRPRRTPGASILRRVVALEAWRVRRRGPLPYAVAIAAGGMFLLFSIPRA